MTTINKPATLKSTWVDQVFAKLIGIYGSQFSAKFSQVVDGKDVGLALAKQAWGEELVGFQDKPEAIAYALKNLPSDFPPNALQFTELCRAGAKHIKSNAPVPALTYTYDHAKAKKFADELADVVKSANRGSDPRFWATHPKGHLAFEYIRGAASNNPAVFQPCIDHLISEGKVSEDGKKLLQAYAGNGEWKKA